MRIPAPVIGSLLMLVILGGLAPPASAGIGAGSKMTVTTQTQMLSQQGGGYVDWEISGPVATLVRQNVDGGFGDGDGNVTSAEAQAYINEVDLVLENYIFYGSARIIRSSLLNKDINTDTSGLIGPVNSNRYIQIHFTFSANLRIDGSTVDFGDLRIPMAAFRALRGEPNQTFDGKLEWQHTEIVVGMASFSGVNPDRGHFSRFRGPGFEVLWYGLEMQNGTSRDQARFDTFNVVQCPLELFVAVCVFGVFTLWLPRHFMKSKKKLRVRWLHLLALLLVILALALFFIGADGLVIWLASPLLMVLSYVLSWGIYSAGWKGIARSSVPVVPARPQAAGPPVSPLSEVRSAREWADRLPVVEGVAVSAESRAPAPPRPPAPAGDLAYRQMPPPPSAAPPSPMTPKTPGPPPLYRRDLRCPKCKGTFPVGDDGKRPLAIKCTLCGAEGVLRK